MRAWAVVAVAAVLVATAGVARAQRSPKKGMVIPNWPTHYCRDWDNMEEHVSWFYNYLPIPDAYYKNSWWCHFNDTGATPGNRKLCFPSESSNVEFFPMINGFEPMSDCGYDVCGDDIPDEYQTILGFNEPNQADQADMTPQEAAAAWLEVMERYPDRTLVSPATAGINIPWMDEFMAECELLGCRIDYLATHDYSKDRNATKTINRLREYSERYGGLKIWFTEFAVRNDHDEADTIQFIEDLLPLLEHSEFIHKYSWFLSRYYEDYNDGGSFWIDPAANTIKEFHTNELTNVGKAYMKPYHLDIYKPKHMV